MKKPLSGILSSLIVLTEEVITRPQGGQLSPAAMEKVARLSVDVREADKAIYEGEPATSAACVAMICIEQFILHRGKGLGAQWLGLLGATLPLLREESFTAFRNEREASRS